MRIIAREITGAFSVEGNYCCNRYRELFSRKKYKWCAREIRLKFAPRMIAENSRFHDRQSPTFLNLDIYSPLSWFVRASRARYIATSIEGVSFKVVAVDLDGFYGTLRGYSCVSDRDYQDFFFVFYQQLSRSLFFSPRKKAFH